MSIQHVLVVDDDPLSREFLIEALHAQGLRTTEATSGEQGLKCARDSTPDLVLTDLRMPGTDGMQLVDHVLEIVGIAVGPLRRPLGGGVVSHREGAGKFSDGIEQHRDRSEITL